MPDFDILGFATIDKAIAHAEALVRQNGYTQIEIMDGDATTVVTGQPAPSRAASITSRKCAFVA